jgi:hypothetical protein
LEDKQPVLGVVEGKQELLLPLEGFWGQGAWEGPGAYPAAALPMKSPMKQRIVPPCKLPLRLWVGLGSDQQREA